MKSATTVLLILFAVMVLVSLSFAAGKAEKGKMLFEDPKAFGGQAACSSCHPEGKGLEMSGMKKKEWMTPAGPAKTLKEAVNLCIVNANKGKALDMKSTEMKELVAYIKSLKKKAAY